MGESGQEKRSVVVCGVEEHLGHESGMFSSNLWLYEFNNLLEPDRSLDSNDLDFLGRSTSSGFISGGAVRQ